MIADIISPQLPQYATFQDWLQDTSYIEMIVKGLLIGIIASAPMGPVGILCIQRTLNKGRWEGFATGVGASLSDIIYAIITGFGLKFVIDIIEDPVIALWLKTIGGILLFLFGIYTFMSKPKETVKAVKRNKGEPADYLPVCCYFRHVYLHHCGELHRPNGWLPIHCCWCPAMVVCADMVGRQGAQQLQHAHHLDYQQNYWHRSNDRCSPHDIIYCYWSRN